MIFRSDKMLLNCIQIVRDNEKASVYICRDEAGVDKPRYTVLAIKDHKLLLAILKDCERDETSKDDFLLDHFASHGMDILVFPYEERRPLYDFYIGKAVTTAQSEDICRSLVITCIESKLPYPLLYLVIDQGLIELSKDGKAYISYEMDLSCYDSNKYEKDCVVVTARMILKILEDKTATKGICYQLISKRSTSEGYRSYAELYKDVIIAASPEKKPNIIKRIKNSIYRQQDRFFHLLFIVCLLVGLLALTALIFLMITGDVPWVKVFFNGFKVIGTEHLNRVT